MSPLVLLLTLGAVARVTRLVTDDQITSPLRTWIIRRLGALHPIAYLIGCPWCLSMYVAGGVFTVAWFYGHTAAFLITTAALSASYLVGVAATFVDGSTDA